MSSPSSPQQHEPTMEEILASIRKIISEDQSDAAPAPAVSKPAPVAANVTPMQHDEEPEEADVLELTHEVRDEAPPAAARHEPEPEYAAGSDVPVEDDVMFETVEETQEEKPAMASDDLISDNVRRAMNRAFEPLDQRPETAAPAMPAVEGVHVEAVFTRAIHQAFDPVLQEWVAKHGDDIVARMKPIIREWMDENLPELIGNAVKSEIAAAVRARSKRR